MREFYILVNRFNLIADQSKLVEFFNPSVHKEKKKLVSIQTFYTKETCETKNWWEKNRVFIPKMIMEKLSHRCEVCRCV